MKFLTTFLFLGIHLLSFAQDTPDYLILSGQIEHPNSDSLAVFDDNDELVHVIRLSETSSFRDTLNLGTGYYALNDGTEQTTVYLKPGFDLSLSLDTKQFDESIQYEGVGAAENNYLVQKYLLEEGFGNLRFYQVYAKVGEAEFLRTLDSLYALHTALLDTHKEQMDAHFAFLAGKAIEFEKTNKLVNYPSMHRFVTGDRGFKVSSTYPDPFVNKEDLSNEALLVLPAFIHFVDDYLDKKARELLAGPDSMEFYLAYYESLGKEVKSQKIRDKVINTWGDYNLLYSKERDQLVAKMNSLTTNPEILDKINSIHQSLKRIATGMDSPTFAFYDANEELVSLADLQGKLVYIDIWATWCGPCIKEIPALKALKEEMEGKEIEIVSICTKDSKDRWLAFIGKKKLKGMQLFAPDDNASFFTDYMLNGVPRFILLDREGKIIDANAPRPSNPLLKELLKKHL